VELPVYRWYDCRYLSWERKTHYEAVKHIYWFNGYGTAAPCAQLSLAACPLLFLQEQGSNGEAGAGDA